MCACAAHTRSGLAPMMPTRVRLAPRLLITIRRPLLDLRAVELPRPAPRSLPRGGCGSPRRSARRPRSGCARAGREARDRARARRAPSAPCAARPVPRPPRSRRCWRRARPPACSGARWLRPGARPSRSRSSAGRGSRSCTRGSRRGWRPPWRSPRSDGRRSPGAAPGRRPRRKAGSASAPRRARTRAPARRPRPRRATGWCCASRGGGCRRCPGSGSLLLLCPRPDELQLREDRYLVRERGLAAWQGVVPVDAEVGAVDLRAQVEPDPLVAVGIDDRRADRAGDRYRPADAPDRQLAADRDLAVAGEADVLGAEAELGVALGVEEVGPLQVGGEVLLVDIDARDLRPALERCLLTVDRELGSDLVEVALERPGEVGDLEVDPRMDRIKVPGSGRGYRQSAVHGVCCSFRCVVYY